MRRKRDNEKFKKAIKIALIGMCVCEKNLCVTLFFPRQCCMSFEPESKKRVTVKGETDGPKRIQDD